MPFWDFLETYFAGVGMGAMDLIIFISLLFCFIVMATNFRVGLVVAMLVFAGWFIAFQEFGVSAFKLLAIVILIGIIMALSIYIGFGKRESVRIQ